MSISPPRSSGAASPPPRPPEQRSEAEDRWVSFQPYLLSKGYQLRPRYQPDWVPSWTITGDNPFDCEDSADSIPLRTLDAMRLADKRQVVIKMIIPSKLDREGEEELQIIQHFSSPPHSDNPSNHAVPCLDSFPIPGMEDSMFYVMPLLSEYMEPPFCSLSDIHDFLVQVIEGLEFLHKNGVAHCDIASANIMMDASPLYDEPFHPFYQHRSLDGKRLILPKYLRSQRPVRYYYIDFGYAKWFRDPNTPRSLVGTLAREPAPEQMDGAAYDPFIADIFQLGAVLRRDVIPSRINPISPSSCSRDDQHRSWQTTDIKLGTPNNQHPLLRDPRLENSMAVRSPGHADRTAMYTVFDWGFGGG
ncbi:hypothetical protein FRC12_017748 [Ceratobasidium sp. 428]|nr:hypothetical protein FRC12_017748 [Ceratobasidium sp. 428]